MPLCVAWLYSIVAAGIDAAAVRLLSPGEDSGASVLCAPPLLQPVLGCGCRVRAHSHDVAVPLSLRGGEGDGEEGEEEEDEEDYERLREMKLRKNQVDDVEKDALIQCIYPNTPKKIPTPTITPPPPPCPLSVSPPKTQSARASVKEGERAHT